MMSEIWGLWGGRVFVCVMWGCGRRPSCLGMCSASLCHGLVRAGVDSGEQERGGGGAGPGGRVPLARGAGFPRMPGRGWGP